MVGIAFEGFVIKYLDFVLFYGLLVLCNLMASALFLKGITHQHLA